MTSGPPTTFRIQCNDGSSVHTRHWGGAHSPKAVIHIAHGMAEHSRRYSRLASTLVDAEYEVYAHDHRGHGESVANQSNLGRFGADGWNALVRDLSTVHAWIRERHAGTPFVALGHSMGSFALQQLLLDESSLIDGAVLSGSTALDQIAAGIAVSEPLDVSATDSLFNARFQPARTANDWLSRDEDEVDVYIADPLCGFALEADAARDLAAAATRLADTGALAAIRPDLPLYLFSGSDDPIHLDFSALDLLVARYREAGLTNIHVRSYSGGRHEMLNETNRDEVVGDLIDWLNALAR